MAEPYRKSSTRDTFESLVITVILAVFGTTFVVQAYKIPTGSMEKTLLIGDHLLVNKFCFSDQTGWLRHILPYRTIHRRDILVFKFPYNEEQEEPGTHLVKRVIGVPGDHIRIVNRQVFVNGVQQNEPYVNRLDDGIRHPGDSFPPPPGEFTPDSTPRWDAALSQYVKNGELVVPPGEYFVMGDNRENSWDSRFWGFVPRSVATGRPLIIYWSYETPPGSYLLTSFSDRLSQIASMFFHFFTKTRWRRAFRLVR
ncbi:MAG TPA: signal peptidase I [Terriglobia bacterium]|nr:signal peptidase I [Terriglobia bacterium]